MDNIICGLILCDQGNHLGFRKYSTHTGNRDIFLKFQPTFTHLVQIHFHGAGHHFQETPGAGSTFVIHNKVCHCTIFVQADHLAVLSADINNCAHLWIQKMCPSCMAGNLRNALISILDCSTSITGRHKSIDIFSLQSGFCKCFGQSAFSTDCCTGTCRKDHTGYNFMLFI